MRAFNTPDGSVSDGGGSRQIHCRRGLLVGRRLGAVYLGIAIMLFLARSTPPSDLRSTVSTAMLVALALLALLGLIEFKAKRAGIAILVSVVLEVLLAASFVSVLFA